MSTLALDGSSELRGPARGATAARYLDLPLLALALPIFLVADLPMLGYAVAAGAWLAQRAIQFAAERRASRVQARGERRSALGLIAATTLARVWLISLAILLGGLAEREAGLAAAVLTLVLFTVYLGAQVVGRLLAPEVRQP